MSEAGGTTVVFAGAGPRAAMLLERMLSRLDDHAAADDAPIEIVLVDPHPPGAGRIWRRAQSPLLKLNSMARDVTVFTDDSCRIDGPIRPGPSLIEWAEGWRDGDLPEVDIDDPAAAAEARGLRGESFPTRRLHSYYMEWFYRRTVAHAPRGVTVTWRPGVVTSVRRGEHGRHDVSLADGTELVADVVVYCLGHNGREHDGATLALVDAARQEGLVYVPPDFTADSDLSVLPAGEDVIVRGMGLAAVDLVVLLTEGRGGRFTRDADGALRYRRSGLEPRLHLGSRRGVPYRSKVSSVIQGEPPQREVLTPESIAALIARPAKIDFDDDVWPLIAAELLHGHYQELFTGHPDRVHGTWEQFREVLRGHTWDDPALSEAIAAAVPDPLDRFDVPSLDRPLGDETFASADELQHRIRAHIADDLLLRTTQRRSPAQGVFLAVLLSFLAVSEIPDSRWNARSRAWSLPVTWHKFFSYVASGPPAHRLEELLALAEAGIVRFAGPDIQVRIEPGRGFVATTPRAPGEIAATALVDAWLPDTGAAASDNPALRELAHDLGQELRVADGGFEGSLGRVRVDEEGRILRPDATAHPALFGIGPFTAATEGGAFTRPRSDSLSFRQTDRVAGAIVARVRAAAAVPG